MADKKAFTEISTLNACTGRLRCNVERLTKAEHAHAVAAAAAHDLNNELTVILSTVSDLIGSMELGHPARPQLQEVEQAAQRCARKSSGLLIYGIKGGPRAASTPLETLLTCD